MLFGPGLISCRDNAGQGAADGEDHKKFSSGVGSAEQIVAVLDLRVRFVIEEDEWLIEEDLLTLLAGDVVILPILGVVSLIPFESDELRKVEQIFASVVCVHRIRTRVLRQSEPELGAREGYA